MTYSPIRKAVFPVAGLGTRFLPATKSIPKEMLPIVDKALIQYAVEEAVEAGIETMIFVTSHRKRAILDYFDPDEELQSYLLEQGKDELYTRVRNIIPSHVSTAYVIQEEALGLGHAVLCAKQLVGDEPFAVLLAHAFEGVRYDCGSRQGFIRATVDYALEHDELREGMLAYFDSARDL